VKVHEKADRNSKVVYVAPDTLQYVKADSRVKGLNDSDLYWSVVSYSENPCNCKTSYAASTENSS
jgi:hypothetical protein